MYALTLAGIPLSIGANEAVYQQRLLDAEAEADERHDEFYLDVFCAAPSRKKHEVHGAMVVLRDGKIWLWPKDADTGLPAEKEEDGGSGGDGGGVEAPHPFTGLYVPFPDEHLPHRPIPAAPVLGLVSTVPAGSTQSGAGDEAVKRKLNWVFADERTRELRYGPRAEAKNHVVGPWDWTEDEQGLTLDGEECLVAVEEERGGYGWAVYWDKEDDALKSQGTGKDKRVLKCSLERRLVQEKRMKRLDED